MGKILQCKDIGMDCDFVAHADTEEEILKKAAEHAATTHDMKEIPEEVLVKVRAAIRDEQRCRKHLRERSKQRATGDATVPKSEGVLQQITS